MSSVTVDMSEFQKQGELKDSTGISKIAGKEIYITGFSQTRGKPTKYTARDKIGEDGKTDYFTIETSESFEIGDAEYDSFFVTPAIAAQINRVPNVQELFRNGGRLGPAKAGKKQSKKDPDNEYWCLLFPGEEGY